MQAAVALLALLGEEARILAGGHSLIPMMKLRLAEPAALVDIARLRELKGIREEGGELVIGAAATQHELIDSDLLARRCPILREAALTIADPQVRYQGTLGGNVANGDPGNDMPALMQCLDATYHLLGRDGERKVKARDFYQGAYFTSLEPGEILTAIRIPVPAAGHGYAYEKLKRKVGDYATAAAAVLNTNHPPTTKTPTNPHTKHTPTPVYAADASAALAGSDLGQAALDKAVIAAEAQVAPASDGRGPAEYRRRMAGVMLRRAVQRARSRAS
jgi:carbon-monoxide dehydrogenase medium subunit